MLLISSAQAQTAEAIHAASQAGDQIMSLGPIGGVFVLVCLALTFVVVMLWRALGQRDDHIAALNEKRADSAARLEGVITSAKGSIDDFARSLAAATEASDDRFETVKAIQSQLVGIAQLVGANGDKLKHIDSDLLSELLSTRGRRS